MKILFVGGGSIGHLAPNVAVWQALRALRPDAEAHVVCSTREDDAGFLREEGLSSTAIPVPRASPLALLKNFRAMRMARDIVTSFSPDIVFSTGGALGIPIAIAAHRRNIPIVLLNCDSVSGRANRFMARFAVAVCQGFPADSDERIADSQESATDRYPLPTSRFVGNPIRESVLNGSREKGLASTGFSGTRPILLVLGGSQGALALNRIIDQHRETLLAACDVIHITGKGKEGAQTPDARYWSRPFVHEELAHLYAIADLAISRGGANTLSELAAYGIPTIVVPLRGVAQDHQWRNASVLADRGAALLVEQEALAVTGPDLVSSLLQDQKRRERLSSAMRQLAGESSARRIAELLIKVFSDRKGD